MTKTKMILYNFYQNERKFSSSIKISKACWKSKTMLNHFLEVLHEVVQTFQTHYKQSIISTIKHAMIQIITKTTRLNFRFRSRSFLNQNFWKSYQSEWKRRSKQSKKMLNFKKAKKFCYQKRKHSRWKNLTSLQNDIT